MKHTAKFILGAALILCMGLGSAKAQKFAYIDFQELIQQMPEYKKANTDMEAFGKGLQDELKKINEELEKKYADYQKNEAKMAETIKELKQKELREIQSRLQTKQESAQEDVRKLETELLKPIIEKAKGTIGTVAKESGYAYVFDSSPGTPLLYKPEGDNIMGAVKKKLGIL
ncbi:MAG: OmpH family outer membrane protein [Bacteroidota bacterium]